MISVSRMWYFNFTSSLEFKYPLVVHTENQQNNYILWSQELDMWDSSSENHWFLGTGLLDMHLHHIFNCYQLYTYKYQLFNWHSYFTTNKITIICCSEILHLCILIHSLRFLMNWSIHASLDSYRYHPVDWGIYVCIQSTLL